jgi:hypothetical protein
MEKEEFLKLLPKLIMEDNEVKGAIITTLSGIVATKDDIKSLIEHFDKRFEAMDKRFEAMDKRFEAMQAQMDKRFEAMQAQMDKRFDIQHKELMNISVAIGALGRRSGKSLENTILAILNDEIIKENIDASQIKKEYLFDEHGTVFWKNYNSDIDILIQNGKIILIEVKYHASKHKIERFVRNSKLYTLQFKKDFDELVMICLEIKRSDLRVAREFGVKIIAGSILQ